MAVTEQATKSDGNLGADVLAEANNTYWTRSAWRDRAAMQAVVAAQPHLDTMPHLGEWCDEASFVDWEQTSADLPDWQTSFRRIVADGTTSALPHASAANETRAFPLPVEAR